MQAIRGRSKRYFCSHFFEKPLDHRCHFLWFPIAKAHGGACVHADPVKRDVIRSLTHYSNPVDSMPNPVAMPGVAAGKKSGSAA